MFPFSEIVQEDPEICSTTLSLDLSAHGVDFLLQALAVGFDEFNAGVFAASLACDADVAVDGFGAARGVQVAGLQPFLAFWHFETRV